MSKGAAGPAPAIKMNGADSDTTVDGKREVVVFDRKWRDYASIVLSLDSVSKYMSAY